MRGQSCLHRGQELGPSGAVTRHGHCPALASSCPGWARPSGLGTPGEYGLRGWELPHCPPLLGWFSAWRSEVQQAFLEGVCVPTRSGPGRPESGPFACKPPTPEPPAPACGSGVASRDTEDPWLSKAGSPPSHKLCSHTWWLCPGPWSGWLVALAMSSFLTGWPAVVGSPRVGTGVTPQALLGVHSRPGPVAHHWPLTSPLSGTRRSGLASAPGPELPTGRLPSSLAQSPLLVSGVRPTPGGLASPWVQRPHRPPLS